MIENLNDAIGLIALIGMILYIFYLVFRGIGYRRLERHLRMEQRYYREWMNEEEHAKAQAMKNGGQ